MLLFQIKSCIPIIEKNVIYILTLPTPKQEEIAQYISKNTLILKLFVSEVAKNAARDWKWMPESIV